MAAGAGRADGRPQAGPVDDVVPAARPITLADLLTFRAGYGFPSDFSLPVVGLLFSELRQGPPEPQLVAAPDEWMAALSRIPLLHQPGDAWLYNTCSDILGVLIARVSGHPLPEFLAERLFGPLAMADTGFGVPAGQLGRFTSLYRADPGGGLELIDGPGGQWSSLPAFPSGGGGLVSTAGDWHSFARMLLAGGTAGGRRLLSPESVRQMTTDHLTPSQRAASRLFLEGQGWGFGGSVDVEAIEPWNVPGRYGWVGGTGTAAHITASAGAVTILLSQLETAGPTAPALMRDFWQYAARRLTRGRCPAGRRPAGEQAGERERDSPGPVASLTREQGGWSPRSCPWTSFSRPAGPTPWRPRPRRRTRCRWPAVPTSWSS